MKNKQIIIDDQNETIHRLQQECTEETNAIIALGEQLKAKEQECERMRFPMRDTNYAILTKEEFEQLNQLKKTNEELQKDNKHLSEKEEEARHYLEEAEKFKNCLTEIKGIAKEQQSWNEWNSKHSETESEDDIFAYNWSALNQILQKISEVENV